MPTWEAILDWVTTPPSGERLDSPTGGGVVSVAQAVNIRKPESVASLAVMVGPLHDSSVNKRSAGTLWRAFKKARVGLGG